MPAPMFHWFWHDSQQEEELIRELETRCRRLGTGSPLLSPDWCGLPSVWQSQALLGGEATPTKLDGLKLFKVLMQQQEKIII